MILHAEDEVVAILRKLKPGKSIRRRGKPAANPFFWPDLGILGPIERELEAVVKSKLQGPFAYDDFYVRYKIREFLWRLYRSGDPAGKVMGKAARKLLSTLNVPTVGFDVMWDVSNLDPPDAAIAVDGVNFGALGAVCQEFSELLLSKYSWIASAKTLGRVRVQAPNQALAKLVSREAVEQALDFLSSLYARSRTWLGDYDGLSVGENVVLLDPDPRKITSSWVRGRRNYVPVGISRALWEETGKLRKAPPRPWEDPKVSVPFRELIRSAYRRFGQAVRNQGDANACIPMAMSALEILLCPESPKRHVMAARLVRASTLGGLSVPHPLAIAGWYVVRNEILHEGRSVTWADKGADLLWDVYRILDVLSALYLQKGIATKTDLVASLSGSQIVSQATSAIDKELQLLESMRQQAVTITSKARLQRAIVEWKKVRGQISR